MTDIESTPEFKRAKEQTLIFISDAVMKEYIYKTKDINIVCGQIEEIVPERKDFFVNWFRGFSEVANLRFDSAEKFYSAALKEAEKAEEYTEQFVQQGFTLFMYGGRKRGACGFWDFGVKKNTVSPLDGAFFAGFNAKEQFWTQFPPAMFVDEKKSTELAVRDYKKEAKNPLDAALRDCNFDAFLRESENCDFNTYKIDGVSILYYAVQFKSTLKRGSGAFKKELADFRARQFCSRLNLKNVPLEKQRGIFLTVQANMRQLYEKSGLGKIIFYAQYCKDDEINQKLKEISRIISLTIQKTDDADSFKTNCRGGISNTALYLAAEADDKETAELLLKKGANPNLKLGKAPLSIRTKNGGIIQTEIPNTFVYRLINFSAWNTLKMYLSDFHDAARESMTEKSSKNGITPLVYFIQTTVYGAADEDDFNERKKIADELLPYFEKAGAALEQNTPLGTAKSLLGLE